MEVYNAITGERIIEYNINEEIEVKFCACGCGEKIYISKYKKNDVNRLNMFKRGHQNRIKEYKDIVLKKLRDGIINNPENFSNKISQCKKGNSYHKGHKEPTVAEKARIRWSNKDFKEKVREKIRIKRATQIFPYEDTEIELDIQDSLIKQNIPFETHKIIKGLLSKPYKFHRWDIVLEDKKILIEVQGCYWHGCSICFPNSSINQRNTIIKDNEIKSIAENKGWKVIYIWEHTIRDSIIEFKV